MSGGGDDGNAPPMLQCPDVLPHSQRSCSPHRREDPAPSHSSSPTKSPCRHSVSFQLQTPDATGSPTQFHRHHLSHDSSSQLLQVLAPGATGPGQRGSLGRTCSSGMDPYHGRMLYSPASASSGTMTVPSTPTGNRRAYEVPGVGGEEGKTSVVTFGYIEKFNVLSMGGRRSSLCQSELSNPLNRMEGLQKRSSDPVRYNGPPGQGEPYYNHPGSPRMQSPQGSPYLQRASPDTDRALEEFESPERRRRFAGHNPENCSPDLPRHYQSPRCRSLGGSPILPRRTVTLPSKALELDGGVCRSSLSGLPRSPASDHLCFHSGYSSHSGAPPRCSRGPTHSQQRPWVWEERPRLSSKFHPPLPAGRPTDIQHRTPASIFHTSNHSRTGYQARENPTHVASRSYCSNLTSPTHSLHSSTRDNVSSQTPYEPSCCGRRAGDAVSPTYGRRSISPSVHAEVAYTLAVEATKLSGIFAERQSPSPASSQSESLRSESPKMGVSFLRESQPYAALRERTSPEPLQADNHNLRWTTDKALAQTRPGRVSTFSPQKGLSSPASPARPAGLHRAAASQSPVLDPRHQRDSSPFKDASALHRYQPPQYTGDHKPPGMELKQYDHLFDRYLEESPELSRRLLSRQNTEAFPVSWSSRQQRWSDGGPVQDGDELWEDNYRRSTSKVYTPIREEYPRKVEGGKGKKASSQESQSPVLSVSRDVREEDHSGAAATASQSSSGVTGSLGDSQMDRNDSLSPETSSQSSHDTADTGSGIQVGWVGGWLFEEVAL